VALLGVVLTGAPAPCDDPAAPCDDPAGAAVAGRGGSAMKPELWGERGAGVAPAGWPLAPGTKRAGALVAPPAAIGAAPPAAAMAANWACGATGKHAAGMRNHLGCWFNLGVLTLEPGTTACVTCQQVKYAGEAVSSLCAVKLLASSTAAC
jgi:hypothetical protein